MKKNKKTIIIIVGGGILAVLSLLVIYFLSAPVSIPENFIENVSFTSPEPEKEVSSQEQKAILEINGQRYEGAITAGGTVYGFMTNLREEGKINFTEKTYVGMGKIIVTINGVKSNGEYTWIYYVNDKEAEVGVSNYKINPGDVVSWKYEKVIY